MTEQYFRNLRTVVYVKLTPSHGAQIQRKKLRCMSFYFRICRTENVFYTMEVAIEIRSSKVLIAWTEKTSDPAIPAVSLAFLIQRVMLTRAGSVVVVVLIADTV